MDQWPGYLAERSQLLNFCQQRRVANPVVLTGDIHSNWVNDLRRDDRDPQGEVIAHVEMLHPAMGLNYITRACVDGLAGEVNLP